MSYYAPTLQASGTTWAQFAAGGLSAILENALAAQETLTAPASAPTVNPTNGGTTGGLLAAGTYYVKETQNGSLGETLPGAESSQFTVAAGDIPTVTFASLVTGAVSHNVYLTPANGAQGTEVLYASGITGSTYNLAAAAPTTSIACPPPTENTTGITVTNSSGAVVESPVISMVRSAKDGHLESVYRYARTAVADYLRGDPIVHRAAKERARFAHAALLIITQSLGEAITLMDSNPGHMLTTQDPIGLPEQKRQWP